ncbi:MAG: BACON domain-containing protein, partial [Bryobacteraceae bacterium]
MTIHYQIGAASLPAAQTLSVQTNPKGLNFTVSVSGAPFDAAWLLVSENSGVSPASIKVQANPTGLAAGAYAATISISAASGGQTIEQSTPVTLLVASAAPSLSATPASLSFNYTTGNPIDGPSLSKSFLLSSSGAAVSATLTASGAPWLTLSPSGSISLIGLLNTVSAAVNPAGLAPGVYTGQIKIGAPAATNKAMTVAVTLTVSAAVPAIAGVWPPGVIQGSGQTVATIQGSSYFSKSTVAVSGFTPATTVSVTDGTNTATETMFIPVYSPTAPALRLAAASPLPAGVVNTAYSATLAAAGGTAPYSFAIVSGNPPPGLAIGGNQLAGTPTGAGTFLFTIQAADSSTPPVQAYSQFTLRIDPTGATILRIEGPAAPSSIGIVGTAYGPVTLAGAGGVSIPTYTWSATNLPPGLTLSSTGVLSGTPSADGSGGALAATVVSDSALLATVPSADLSAAGMLRFEVTTPAPGGGISNEGQFEVYGPEPQIGAVVNSASYAQGSLAPGDLIAIFGVGLGPSTLTLFDPSSPPIPEALPAASPSTSVTINGIPAPVLYTSATQVGAI